MRLSEPRRGAVVADAALVPRLLIVASVPSASARVWRALSASLKSRPAALGSRTGAPFTAELRDLGDHVAWARRASNAYAFWAELLMAYSSVPSVITLENAFVS